MPDGIFGSIYSGGVTLPTFLAASAAALALGAGIAWCYRRLTGIGGTMSGTLLLLPFLVQVVILLVNGNLGAGVAVAGTFSLVRFRSAPGTARDICAIFLAMTVGLACGMGYLAVAAFAAAVICVIFLVQARHSASSDAVRRELKITIPENLDYTGLFDDLLREYTTQATLLQVKTANLGSLYTLRYQICLRDAGREKELLDQLRCRNGNLDIVCGRIPEEREVL